MKRVISSSPRPSTPGHRLASALRDRWAFALMNVGDNEGAERVNAVGVCNVGITTKMDILEKLEKSRSALAGMAEHKHTARAMYHFFSDSDPAGPELALFALAGPAGCALFGGTGGLRGGSAHSKTFRLLSGHGDAGFRHDRACALPRMEQCDGRGVGAGRGDHGCAERRRDMQFCS